VACSPTYELSNGKIISKKEIITEIEKYHAADEASLNFKGHKVKIVKRFKERTESDSNDVVIEDLKLGKLSKAIYSGKRIRFYYKTDSTLKKYYQPDMINVFQSNSINDDLFNEEIDRIIKLLENGVITMSEIESNLNKDYGSRVQYFPPSSFAEASAFIPDVIDLLEDKKVLKVYKTKKVDIGNVSYLSLIQNIGKYKENPVYQYLSITLK
jgi:hypothetical protein